jgi:hypothetical protein
MAAAMAEGTAAATTGEVAVITEGAAATMQSGTPAAWRFAARQRIGPPQQAMPSLAVVQWREDPPSLAAVPVLPDLPASTLWLAVVPWPGDRRSELAALARRDPPA